MIFGPLVVSAMSQPMMRSGVLKNSSANRLCQSMAVCTASFTSRGCPLMVLPLSGCVSNFSPNPFIPGPASVLDSQSAETKMAPLSAAVLVATTRRSTAVRGTTLDKSAESVTVITRKVHSALALSPMRSTIDEWFIRRSSHTKSPAFSLSSATTLASSSISSVSALQSDAPDHLYRRTSAPKAPPEGLTMKSHFGSLKSLFRSTATAHGTPACVQNLLKASLSLKRLSTCVSSRRI
mmetsp:Transcript_35182/g.77426  ORF Transcript_35182/g.77426 Transcript_35182/m.77426 type:complete len:237 (-) Transcript_35182:369-1079(-)